MERRTGIGFREKEGKCSAEERASRLLILAVTSQYRATVAWMAFLATGTLLEAKEVAAEAASVAALEAAGWLRPLRWPL